MENEYFTIVGVQFQNVEKIYDFSLGSLDLVVGDYVLVEIDKRGHDIGQVRYFKYKQLTQEQAKNIKTVIRKAEKKELEKFTTLKPCQILSFAKSKVREWKLNMRIVDMKAQFGGGKIVLFFIAPVRVDFRGLVKDLSSSLRTRVELKQMGSRDETKVLGALGLCGRELCCARHLVDFVPVCLKMVRNQNLTKNPEKTSGNCSRLLCCLHYEDETYTQLRKNFPPISAKVEILETHEVGYVLKTDVLNQNVLVKFEDGQSKWYPLDKMKAYLSSQKR